MVTSSLEKFLVTSLLGKLLKRLPKNLGVLNVTPDLSYVSKQSVSVTHPTDTVGNDSLCETSQTATSRSPEVS